MKNFPESPFVPNAPVQPQPAFDTTERRLGKQGVILKQRMKRLQGATRAEAELLGSVHGVVLSSEEQQAAEKLREIRSQMERAEAVIELIHTPSQKIRAYIELMDACREMHRGTDQYIPAIVSILETCEDKNDFREAINLVFTYEHFSLAVLDRVGTLISERDPTPFMSRTTRFLYLQSLAGRAASHEDILFNQGKVKAGQLGLKRVSNARYVFIETSNSVTSLMDLAKIAAHQGEETGAILDDAISTLAATTSVGYRSLQLEFMELLITLKDEKRALTIVENMDNRLPAKKDCLIKLASCPTVSPRTRRGALARLSESLDSNLPKLISLEWQSQYVEAELLFPNTPLSKTIYAARRWREMIEAMPQEELVGVVLVDDLKIEFVLGHDIQPLLEEKYRMMDSWAPQKRLGTLLHIAETLKPLGMLTEELIDRIEDLAWGMGGQSVITLNPRLVRLMRGVAPDRIEALLSGGLDALSKMTPVSRGSQKGYDEFIVPYVIEIAKTAVGIAHA